jgi:hypothetical protein
MTKNGYNALDGSAEAIQTRCGKLRRGVAQGEMPRGTHFDGFVVNALIWTKTKPMHIWERLRRPGISGRGLFPNI